MSEAMKGDQSREAEGAEVIRLADYWNKEERINPAELSDEAILAFVLSKATHPGVAGSAERLAASLLTILPNNAVPAGDEWTLRTADMSVSAVELDDDEYDVVASDEVVKGALAVIKAKDGRQEDGGRAAEAARALIDLRAGIVLHRPELRDMHSEEWRKIIQSLGS